MSPGRCEKGGWAAHLGAGKASADQFGVPCGSIGGFAAWWAE